MPLQTTQLRPLACFIGIASLLVAHHFLLRLIAPQFLYEVDLSKAPQLVFVATQIAAGFVYLLLLRIIPTIKQTKLILLFMVLVGLGFRLSLFGTTPIMEVDYYRYLWDGAVLGEGFNPYLLSPNMISVGAQTELATLARDAGIVFDRINYPHLRTIYPPITQGMFAVSYWIDAWNLDTWRALLLISEAISLILLILLLRSLNRSSLWAALYWWNPLVTKEVFNSVHMDAFLVPFILAAIWLIINKRNMLSATMLTLAAGIKLWPLLLLSFSLRPLLYDPKRLVLTILWVTILSIVVIGPLLLFGLGENSGLSAYSQSWQQNSGLFQLILAIAQLPSMLIPAIDANLLARAMIAMLLGGLTLYLNRGQINNNERLVQSICWVVAALFLLSPTQYPWYTLWLTPLLCFYPQRGLVLLTALMPIYYLRFNHQISADFFNDVIVWLQYLPVLILLGYDNWNRSVIKPIKSKQETVCDV